MYPSRRVEPLNQFRPRSSAATQAHAAIVRATPRIQAIALSSSDVVAFVLSVFLAFAVGVATLPSPLQRAIGNLTLMGAAWHGWGTLLVFLTVLGFFAARGHYNSRVPFWTQLHDVVMATAVGLACDTFLTIAVYDRPVGVEGLLRWVLYAPSLLMLRSAVRGLLSSGGLWTINTLIIADAAVYEQTRAALLSDGTMGYRLVGTLGLAEAALLRDEQLQSFIESRGAEFVVVAVGSSTPVAERNVVAALRRARLPVALVPAWDGLPVVGLRQHHFFSHDIVMLVSRNNLARPFSRILKAGFDQLVALILLVLLAPLMIALALLARADGGRAFYHQRRLGAQGVEFDCLKFRTMVPNAEEVLHDLLERDPEAAQEWAATQKLRDDPRVTRLGRFLRRSSLDELPQLFNVLRGDMSLVGPRPIVQGEVSRYGDDIHYYFETKPGLTGLWQVSGRSDTSYERRVRLDVWYVRNWTLWHDIAILLQTIPAVFLQRGAQ